MGGGAWREGGGHRRAIGGVAVLEGDSERMRLAKNSQLCGVFTETEDTLKRLLD
jgi:hypothetical protein